jgi:hypothetical protein
LAPAWEFWGKRARAIRRRIMAAEDKVPGEGKTVETAQARVSTLFHYASAGVKTQEFVLSLFVSLTSWKNNVIKSEC